MQITIDHLDLKQIAESGQCFRWRELGHSRYGIPSAGRYIIAEQTPDGIELDCTRREWDGFWANYFDARADYGLYIDSIEPEDTYLREAARTSGGIRILAQDPWEMLVSFIISQNNNIPRIKKSIEALCRSLGKQAEHGGIEYYTFPTAEAMAQPRALENLGLGYRDKYLAKLAQNVVEGTIDIHAITGMSYEEARAELKGIYGIGDKVADCVCLFGLGKKEAFPKDRWINRVIAEHYGGKFPTTRYEGFAGVIQQYIFHHEITNK